MLKFQEQSKVQIEAGSDEEDQEASADLHPEAEVLLVDPRADLHLVADQTDLQKVDPKERLTVDLQLETDLHPKADPRENLTVDHHLKVDQTGHLENHFHSISQIESHLLVGQTSHPLVDLQKVKIDLLKKGQIEKEEIGNFISLMLQLLSCLQ